MVIPVLRTLERANPSGDGKAAGYIPLSPVDVLELVENAIAQARSENNKALSAVLLCSWVTSGAHTFATTSLKFQPHARPARCKPRDDVVADMSSTSPAAARRRAANKLR